MGPRQSESQLRQIANPALHALYPHCTFVNCPLPPFAAPSAASPDFGLSRNLGPSSRVETATYGTIAYAAPEVLEHGLVTKAADVYSYGLRTAGG